MFIFTHHEIDLHNFIFKHLVFNIYTHNTSQNPYCIAYNLRARGDEWMIAALQRYGVMYDCFDNLTSESNITNECN